MTKQYYCPRCKRVHAFYRQASPVYRQTWQQMAVDGAKEAGEVILGVAVLLAFFFGIPWLAWLVLA